MLMGLGGNELVGYSTVLSVVRDLPSLYDEPSDFVLQFHGTVHAAYEDNSTPEVGTVNGCRLLLGEALDRGWPRSDVWDADTTVAGFTSLVDTEADWELRPELTAIESDVLIIDQMRIDPRHRGRGLGLEVMQEVLVAFGAGCAVAAIEPYPMQHDPASDLPEGFCDGFAVDESVARRKLAGYWQKLGFREWAYEPRLWVLDLGRRRPLRSVPEW